jgi:1-aminocyclopropane-1-carboxylate deaminase/D-cysteine desulfhydrase-like pyridoxal-dependent ACC family enzyme
VSRRLTEGLPRVRLAYLPTPLEPAPRLGDALGGLDLWVKREDQSGLAFGGNKVRQLEFILAAAETAGADTVITTAGRQSNFCRAMAAGVARRGMRCILLLRGRGPRERVGNLLLDELLGAEVHDVATDDPYDPAVRDELDRLAEDVAKSGGRPFVVQLPGESGALAAAAAVDLAEELSTQWPGEPAKLYLSIGSGLTAAGLILGFALLRMATEVVGISVQQPSDFVRSLIAERVGEAARLLGREVAVAVGDVTVDDRHRGPGYGRASAESLAAVRQAAETEALILDPVYTGKALAGLAAHVREGRIGPGERVIFLHSGGGPNLFAQADALAHDLRAS